MSCIVNHVGPARPLPVDRRKHALGVLETNTDRQPLDRCEEGANLLCRGQSQTRVSTVCLLVLTVRTNTLCICAIILCVIRCVSHRLHHRLLPVLFSHCTQSSLEQDSEPQTIDPKKPEPVFVAREGDEPDFWQTWEDVSGHFPLNGQKRVPISNTRSVEREHILW